MVTPLPGGAADKAGYRYELLWVVLRLSDLLEGRVGRVRQEPPGAAGMGIELVLDESGVTWSEQTKDTARSWTINRLAREGVLDAAKAQIDLGRHFRLVASSAADDLGTLAHRARKSESYAEYQESLGESRLERLGTVAEVWGVSREDAWLLLQNVKVKHLPGDALERLVTVALRQLFVDDPELVVGALGVFCDQRLHETFTAPQVFAHLESVGLRRRLIVGDTNVINKLRRTRERHACRVKIAEPSIGLVPRGDVGAVIEMLHDTDGDQVVVVDGTGGLWKVDCCFCCGGRAGTGGLVCCGCPDGHRPVDSDLRLSWLRDRPDRITVSAACGRLGRVTSPARG